MLGQTQMSELCLLATKYFTKYMRFAFFQGKGLNYTPDIRISYPLWPVAISPFDQGKQVLDANINLNFLVFQRESGSYVFGRD